MFRRLHTWLVLCFGLFAFAPAYADDYADAVNAFQKASESSRFFSNSYGYALFPTIGKGGIGIGGAHGKGYTLLIHHIGLATAPALYKKLSYKPEDLEFLGLINEAPSTLIGKQSLPATNFADLRKYVAANGGKVTLANAGIGSASHLCSLMLQSALKSDMIFVPYKGTGPAMNDLLGGQVDLMCEQATNSTPQIEAKKVKAFGVTSPQRMTVPALAPLPTLAESGLPGFNFAVWHGLYAVRGTPPEVIQKINAALRTALKDPELIKRQEALGITVVTDGRLAPADHQKFFETEVNRWTKTFKDSGIQPE